MLKNIDPIVLPGLYKSHMRSFYGSDVVTKTLPITEELQKGCSSGENPNGVSVNWASTLYHVDGDSYTEVNPIMFSTYYENIDKAEILFPKDFYAVAGNGSAKSQDYIDERINNMTWWDIKKHAYAAVNGGCCLADMKRMPQLRFSIRYDVRKLIPEGWTGPPPLKLACGVFMRIDGARGEGEAGSSCSPQDADPGNGTSDYKQSVAMMAMA
ncbi:hypothetical protein B0T26DRAFT_740267 [Lasiosphaeria miniovina]|uniref:DUF1996 domain-containing protein n=1 Tax=Lasiosphaeria miniovina TaxID=1954250 RepID=A0AA40E351_9PEZI|nr:uncharacterized protein B0T26DRAFT_740267 [Lasiosphaeria miniovina]KAK0723277.1 hypothetical protein B0T26DRAFT_740267 [Lasiosphaeria miniovina]